MSKIKVEIDSELKEIIPSFLERKQKDVLRLETLIKDEDFAGLKAIGHELKGTCGSYGFDVLAKIAQNIETQAVEQDIDKLNLSFIQFKERLTNIEIVYIKE